MRSSTHPTSTLLRWALLTLLSLALSCSLESPGGSNPDDSGGGFGNDDDGGPDGNRMCGDGRISGGEACDGDIRACNDGCYGGVQRCNGNCARYDECDIGIQACGNGIVEGRCEACDDGNAQSGDGCSADCSQREIDPDCGDGRLGSGEICDASTSACEDPCYARNGRTRCLDDCSDFGACDQTCGDGSVQGCEACDDGNQESRDGCSFDCRNVEVIGDCNNGRLDEGEACDSNEEFCMVGCYAGVKRCRTDCGGMKPCDIGSQACGNGLLEGCELCDDGNNLSGDGCAADCMEIEIIGDCNNGALDEGELCDSDVRPCGEGCYSGYRLCRTNCAEYYPCASGDAACGNDRVEGCEMCDDGNRRSQDGCRGDCSQFEPLGLCNNRRLDPPEFCDREFRVCRDGCYEGLERCRADCSEFHLCFAEFGRCGNGRIEGCEVCDDGNMLDGDGCSADCMALESLGLCNNGRLDPNETCDDVKFPCRGGCYDGFAACRADCGSWMECQTDTQRCGDGRVDGCEACDDANRRSGDGCSTDCSQTERIGDCNNGALDEGEVCDGDRLRCDDGCYLGWSHCKTDCRAYHECNIGMQFCGNGAVEGCEACDDGNNRSGDGCSADCSRIEPVGDCNNGHINEGEYCDLENAYCNDGCYYGFQACRTDCSAFGNCRIGDQYCGNGVIEGCEACDDGNNRSGDGCAADCSQKERIGLCNNGRVDPGEACDSDALRCEDGCYSGWSHCEADCKAYKPCATITYPFCGNGALEGCEVCDDGNNLPGDGCSADCSEVDSSTGCNDGALDAGETCDLLPVPCDDPCYGGEAAQACRYDCSGTFACNMRCGNGIREGCEVCDDGNLFPGDGCNETCSATETINGCNDAKLDEGEECDSDVKTCGDGCYAGFRTCRTDCSGYGPCETGAFYCGDGFIDGCEECDDGNNESGDGCSADCSEVEEIGDCNNFELNEGEVCDRDEVPCDDGCHGGMKRCKTDCTGYGPCLERCGNLETEGCEVCDDGNNEDGDGCSADCREAPPFGDCRNGSLDEGERCDGESIECEDGCYSGIQLCAPNCRTFLPCDIGDKSCGDGQRDDCEACDDGDNRSGDGCSADCSIREGNGECNNEILDPGEVCDTFPTYCEECEGGTRECRADCAGYQECRPDPSECGNDIIEGCEACDDGNNVSGDGCSADCSQTELNGNCNNGTLDEGEACDGVGEPCETGCYDGVRDCRADCSGYKACRAGAQRCGNGITEGCEQCDDGNLIDGDGCQRDCSFTASGSDSCGNGRRDPGETCDSSSPRSCSDGCYDGTQTCREDCSGWDACIFGNKRCGNGMVEGCELCDDGNNASGDGCTANCDAIELNGTCNNRTKEEGEVCDSDTISCNDACLPGIGTKTCLTNCQGYGVCQLLSMPNSVCGNLIKEACEACDDGNNVSGDGCAEDCSETETHGNCNNHTVDPGEVCDSDSHDCNDGCYDGIEYCQTNCAEYTACTVWPQECGNGITEGCELCDDGQQPCVTPDGYQGDQGCAPDCAGWNPCQPSEFCGDGVVNGNEECDDANENPGDGCTNDCFTQFQVIWETSLGTGSCEVCVFDPGTGNYIVEGGCVLPNDADCFPSITASPALKGAGGALLIGASNGKLYEIDSGVGTTIRTIDFGAPLKSSAAVGPGSNYPFYVGATANGWMARYRNATHTWKSDRGSVYGRPALDQSNNRIYFATYLNNGVQNPDGSFPNPLPANVASLFAFSADGRGPIPCTPVTCPDPPAGCVPKSCPNPPATQLYTQGYLHWSAPVGQLVEAGPVIAGDRVLVGNLAGELYSIQRSDGAVAWQADFGPGPGPAPDPYPSIRAEMAVDSAAGKLFVGTLDGKMRSVNLADGAVSWQFVADGPIASGVALGAFGQLYFGTLGPPGEPPPGLLPRGTMYALDRNSGAVAWSFATDGPIRSTPAVGANQAIYFGSDDGKLYALDESTGSLIGVFFAEAPIQSSPTLGSSGRVFFATTAGSLYAIQSGGTQLCALSNCPWPKYGRTIYNRGN